MRNVLLLLVFISALFSCEKKEDNTAKEYPLSFTFWEGVIKVGGDEKEISMLFEEDNKGTYFIDPLDNGSFTYTLVEKKMEITTKSLMNIYTLDGTWFIESLDDRKLVLKGNIHSKDNPFLITLTRKKL